MGMLKADIAMDQFMEKLKGGEFAKEIQPNNGPELTPEFIDEQVQSFTNLMNSGILEAALNEDR